MKKENKLQELAELFSLHSGGVPQQMTAGGVSCPVVPLDLIVVVSGVSAVSVARVLFAIDWIDRTIDPGEEDRSLDVLTIPGVPASQDPERRTHTANLLREAVAVQSDHDTVLARALGLDERVQHL